MENWLGSLGVEYSVKNVRGFASGFGDGEKNWEVKVYYTSRVGD
jgi:hypothetical protein